MSWQITPRALIAAIAAARRRGGDDGLQAPLWAPRLHGCFQIGMNYLNSDNSG